MSSNKRQALGKGLSALLENANTDITTKRTTDNAPTLGSVNNILISQIEANPFQPRNNFEKQALQELADSIKEHGIIQPVTVRKVGFDSYQLISGERRFRASSLAGLKEIPAYIRVANDQAMLEMALVENIQREELDPIEIGLSYQRLIDECNITQEEVSKKVSKQRSTVTNYIRLLKLPVEVQAALRERKLTFGHARALVNVDDKAILLTMYNDILKNGLSVRQTEDMVRDQVGYKKVITQKGNKKTNSNFSPEQERIKKDLSDLFKTKVKFTRLKSGKGTITIPFKSDDELVHILSVLDM